MATEPEHASADPSMEDILASIRRILSEDEAEAPAVTGPGAPQGGTQGGTQDGAQGVGANGQAPHANGHDHAAAPAQGQDADDVLDLDDAMMVAPEPVHMTAPPASGAFVSLPEEPEPEEHAVDSHPQPAIEPIAMDTMPMDTLPMDTLPMDRPAEAPVSEPPRAEPGLVAPGLVAAEAAAGVSASMGALVRRIAAERTTQTHRGGPTIEDMVREELRPMLKAWLDTHLPGLVERLVAAEIERVVGRAAF